MVKKKDLGGGRYSSRDPFWHLNREQLYSWFSYGFLTVLAIFVVFPLFYALGLSLMSWDEWGRWAGKGNWFIIFPEQPVLWAYEKILTNGSIVVSGFLVSVERVILAVSTCLLLSMLAGYIMSRRKIPGRRAIIMLVLIPILFSGGMIPTFLVVFKLGLMNSIWSLVVPGMVDVFAALVFKQFFEAVSPEIEESAVIDGATEIRLMFSIFIPMSTSVVAALSLFMAVANWNAWFDAMLYIQNPKLMPLQLILKQIYMVNEFLETQMSVALTPDYHRFPRESLRMAITIVGILPIMLVYPLVQKHFVKGVYMGAVKG
jgi:putative aldouronate transport system permease protein